MVFDILEVSTPTGFRWYIVPSKNEHHQFEPGMVITDEPGIYEEGDFGIRIENNLLTVNGEKNKYGQSSCTLRL